MLLESAIKRFVFPYIESNMYILIENRSALIIDPHVSEDAEQYLKCNQVDDVVMLLTHEHFDHTNGIPWFRERFQSILVCQQEAMNKKRQKMFDRPLVEVMKLQDEGRVEEAEEIEKKFLCYEYDADVTFDKQFSMKWGEHKIVIEHAPGHSPASSIITLDDKFVFTGDSLIPNVEPTLKWPWSNKDEFKQITEPKLHAISMEQVIMPGHYEPVSRSDLFYQDGIFMTEGKNNGGA